MWYLITQYWFWLLLALLLGLIVGWLTCSKEPRKWGFFPIALIIAAIAFLLTFFRVINGVPALWIESGLLMLATYFAGCCLGCWLKGLLAPAVAAVPLAAPVAAPKPVPVAAPVPVKAPEPVMPKVEGEDLIAGRRPLGLMAPRGGKADDLKLIKGIGKQNEGRLHGLGIWHFDQIAAWTKENVEWVGSYLAFIGRIDREEWVSQAKALASGAETEFAKRVKRGEVSTSKDDGSMGQSNVATMAEDGFEGDRPKNVISAPRGGKGDDLKLINGVGRAIETKLNQLGVWHFDQIAAMNDKEILFLSHWSGFPGRGAREDWKGEAATLAKGGETAHSKAVKAGKVPSSLANPKGKK
jgi:predicted flap endonuclease-1-like 5' DNA nuclease